MAWGESLGTTAIGHVYRETTDLRSPYSYEKSLCWLEL